MTFHATTNRITREFRKYPCEYFQAREYFQVDSTQYAARGLKFAIYFCFFYCVTDSFVVPKSLSVSG